MTSVIMTTAESNMLKPEKTGNIGSRTKSRAPAVLKYLAICLFLILPLAISAQDLPENPTGHVNDFADMLTQTEEQRLETKLRNYRDTTTTVIAIATLNNLQGYPVEEIGTRLFNNWNLWEGDKDNGILILIAKDERQMRIEVGYGLEGAVPDVMAGRIIREILTPRFKQGQFYTGLDVASSAVIQLASGEYTGQLTAENSSSGQDDISSFIVFILFIIFVVYASSRGGGRNNGRKRRQRTLGSGGYIWMGGGGFGGGGGGNSGGFGGFSGGGGFGSGGGGASGGW